jgi:hypothetical protein
MYLYEKTISLPNLAQEREADRKEDRCMPDYDKGIDKFIYKLCYDPIWSSVSKHVEASPNSLELGYCRIEYPNSASLEDMILEFCTDISIDEDTLTFRAVLSCTIELEQETHGDIDTAETSQWFKVSCSAVIKDELKSFVVHDIDIYSRGRRAVGDGVAVDDNIVPRIYPEQLDTEATAFLKRYYPQALEEPMAVPIEEIVRENMGLAVVQGSRLTDNFSLFGQICFTGGSVQLYDVFGRSPRTEEVDRGTIIIDAYTYWERNIGCVNNTIAHEAYHWHRHRIYAAMRGLLLGEKFIACRCPADMRYPNEKAPWTDEQRMEWQADHIAPRILMPVETFKPKAEQLLQQYRYYDKGALQTLILECVIDELATFYNVSKLSAKIRMIDVGYKEVAGVYNFNNDARQYFSKIDREDAFYEYSDNEEFRKVIDSGLFVYADGFFVINDEKYVEIEGTGEYRLTDYAWNNLAECTIQFSYRRVNVSEHSLFHSDSFNRRNPDVYEKLPGYDVDRNVSIVGNAEELKRKRAEFESQYETHSELTQTFWQRAYEIMQTKKWNSAIFCDKTQLNEVVYSRAKNNHESLPDIRTCITICAGLDLDIELTNRLLALAGHALSNSVEHQAYGFIITSFAGKNLDERNAFLKLIGVTTLGSKTRC